MNSQENRMQDERSGVADQKHSESPEAPVEQVIDLVHAVKPMANRFDSSSTSHIWQKSENSEKEGQK